MKITTVAHTHIVNIPKSIADTEFATREDWEDPEATTDLDLLAEMAGRGCYKSWSLPRPETATNEGYLGNIVDHRHFSVFEHGTVTFYVEDVSRALLLELERHRFTSYSVESQRYVDTAKHHKHPIIPPAMQSDTYLMSELDSHYQYCLKKYDEAYQRLRDADFKVKEAREAARAFLPESTPVDFFVSGNIRAWRDVMGKRWSKQADKEIQNFAGKILDELKTIAPSSVQDIDEVSE